MRKHIGLLTIILNTCLIQSQSITDSLIGHWPFSDISGNQLDGVVSGTMLIDDRHGINNKAYIFSQNSDKIVTPNMIRTTSAMTISIWCYPTELDSNYKWLINQRNGSWGNQFQIVVNDQKTYM